MYKPSALLFLMTLSTSALAGTPLSGEQIKHLAMGNTVSIYSIAKSDSYKNHYAADGKAFSLQESNGRRNTGIWRVTDSGEWCVQWKGADDRCGLLIDNGDGTYDRQEDGKARSIWKKIESGNTIPE